MKKFIFAMLVMFAVIVTSCADKPETAPATTAGSEKAAPAKGETEVHGKTGATKKKDDDDCAACKAAGTTCDDCKEAKDCDNCEEKDCDGCDKKVKKTEATSACGSGCGGCGSEGKKVAALTKAQTVCPVMGNPISKEIYADHNGKRVYFCCAGCDTAFKADPEKYIKQLENAGVKLDEAI